MAGQLSIIIPSLNAAQHLPRCLEALLEGKRAQLVEEIIVVMSGADDGSAKIAKEAGARVEISSQGRAKQLIRGAEVARGNWLLFLHADTALAPGWVEAATTHMERHPDKAACFTLAFDREHGSARWLAARANRRSRWFALPYGDQGLLIHRGLFEEVGGFPDIPLMEDVAIVRALGRRRLSILDVDAITSAEKYERDGYRKRAYRNGWLLLRYLLGASPEKLAKSYD